MRTGHLTTQHELGMLWCATRGCARVMARVRLNAHTAPDNATQAGYAMLQAQAAPGLTHTLTKVLKVFDHPLRRPAGASTAAGRAPEPRRRRRQGPRCGGGPRGAGRPRRRSRVRRLRAAVRSHSTAALGTRRPCGGGDGAGTQK